MNLQPKRQKRVFRRRRVVPPTDKAFGTSTAEPSVPQKDPTPLYSFYDEQRQLDLDFAEYLKGKRVAIVGKGVREDTADGDFIDSFDVVVRIHWPFPTTVILCRATDPRINRVTNGTRRRLCRRSGNRWSGRRRMYSTPRSRARTANGASLSQTLSRRKAANSFANGTLSYRHGPSSIIGHFAKHLVTRMV